jgi:AbrB family looped-hinge helix DNA binding protein
VRTGPDEGWLSSFPAKTGGSLNVASRGWRGLPGRPSGLPVAGGPVHATVVIPAGPVTLDGLADEVGPKGQVVIPKDLRDVLGIEPGDEVTLWRDGDHVAVRSVRSARPLRGRCAASALVDELDRERVADRAREDGR